MIKIYRTDGKFEILNLFTRSVAPADTLGVYRVTTNSTTPPPGTGKIKYDNATQISSTNIYVNHITDEGVDIDLFLALLKTNDVLVIQDLDLSDNYQFFTISAPPVHSDPYWQIPVTFGTSGGTGTTGFANNHQVFLGVEPS